ncbi:MAG: hypothetical protein KME54_25775 [Tolypothrix brevis GSE-NOS-MK-07-07A]|nr:hypothetical protein [Tolypothrix brevis GSE-NOS-MK-07-07A]
MSRKPWLNYITIPFVKPEILVETRLIASLDRKCGDRIVSGDNRNAIAIASNWIAIALQGITNE